MLAGLRDRDLSPAFLALVLVLAFLALAFFGLVFLALVRVLVALLAERRRAGFSGVVSGAGVVAGIAAPSAIPRPSPILLANWDRRSE